MDGLVPSVTQVTSQPRLGQLQQRINDLCGFRGYVSSRFASKNLRSVPLFASPRRSFGNNYTERRRMMKIFFFFVSKARISRIAACLDGHAKRLVYQQKTVQSELEGGRNQVGFTSDC